MDTASKETATLTIVGVRFEGDRVYFALSDGREIGAPLSHKYLRWLKNATAERRANWRILSPDGWAVEWPELDDGIELTHLLKSQPF